MADKPHYHGHRQRLRRRFLNGGPEALHDYELLELILYGAIPRRDVKGVAKALLEEFGGLAQVLSADQERLKAAGQGEIAIATLKAVQAAGLRLARAGIEGRMVLSSWSALIEYCQASMAHAPNEEFRVLFLDRKNKLIADEVQQKGTVDHTPVYPREVMKRALELGASALILVHNHPSGDPTPSRADVDMTKHVISAAEPLGITIHDHVVIGRGRHESLRALGLI